VPAPETDGGGAMTFAALSEDPEYFLEDDPAPPALEPDTDGGGGITFDVP
jgi:hypothetical protein